MADSLDEKIQEKIQAVCKEISVAHHLDNEIQCELRGHMEDKVLAFLNGEERMTVEDALILTRAHFGDPVVLKGLMQQVHGVESRDSLTRRIVGALCASTFLSLAFLLVGRYVEMTLSWGGLSIVQRTFVEYAGGLALLWLCLFYWQRRLDAGKPPWFVRWEASKMAVCLMTLFFAKWALDFREGFLNLAKQFPLTLPLTPEDLGGSGIFSGYVLGIMAGYLCLQCLIWLWWCDRPPRLWQNLILTGLAWILCDRLLRLGISALFRLAYARETGMHPGDVKIVIRNQVALMFVSFWSACAAAAAAALVGYLVVRATARLWHGRRANVATRIVL
jgi:hypothetical protein